MGADDFWFAIQQQKVCVEQNDGSSDRVSESNMLQLNQTSTEVWSVLFLVLLFINEDDSINMSRDWDDK